MENSINCKDIVGKDLCMHDNIDLYHEVNNPRNISADKDDSNLGWILVGISLLIMIFLIVNFILTLYSTTYASVVGVTSATGDIIGAFKN